MDFWTRAPSDPRMPPASWPEQTACAASNVNPPWNTARRSNSVAWSVVKSRWLQSMAAAIVCWRSGAPLAPEARTRKRSLRLTSSSRSDMRSSLAAAISIASGRRSSRSQIATTGSRLGGATLNPGTTSRARSSKRLSASGSPSADTGHRTSPGTPRGSRLVARMASVGQRSSKAVANDAHSATRCSQLSRMRSALRDASQDAATCCGDPRPGSSRFATTGPATSDSAASSTHQMPSGHASRVAFATSVASRLLPAPPVPVSVTSRALRTTVLSARSSTSRPTKLVRRTGRLFGAAFDWWLWPATVPMRVSSPRPAAMQRPGGEAKKERGTARSLPPADAPWGSGVRFRACYSSSRYPWLG